MKRWSLRLGCAALLLVTALPARASGTTVEGELSGVEVCPQLACGAAIFTGNFHGKINNRPSLGYFWTAVQHEPLPDPGATVAITGGRWNITTLFRSISGRVQSGTLHNNGDNSFNIDAVLEIDRGGSGSVTFSGLLDHTVFPPTIDGVLLP